MRLGNSKRQRIMPEDHQWYWSMPVKFSQGWRIGDLIFIGGQVSADRQGNVIGEGDIEEQTRNVFENISKVLRDAGSSMADLVELNTYYVYDGAEETLVDYWERMTRVRMEYLVDPGPVGTAVRVAGLAYPGLLIEVNGLAVARDSNGQAVEA
jgi:enamine deaminase RidA (YjgF/YER057c/UK114 family)